MLALIRTTQKRLHQWRTSGYLVDGEHLPVGLLHLLQLPEKVPAHKHSQMETIRKRSRPPYERAKKKMVTPPLRFGEGSHQNLDLARTSLVAQSFMR